MANGNYNLEVTVIPNTKNVQAELNEKTYNINAKVTISGDGKKGLEGLEKTSSDVSKKVQSNLDGITKSSDKVGQSFLDISKKVAKFYLATIPIQMVKKALQEAITTVKDMDSALVELRKVSDLSGESLTNFTEDAFKMAQELSTTASNVTEAVTEFSKSGYDISQSEVLANSAIIFQTIADDAISASDSATMLIQVMKAYNMTAEESMHITDAINEVDILAFPIRNFRVIKDNYIG